MDQQGTTTAEEVLRAGEEGRARALAWASAAFRSSAAEDRGRGVLAFALALQAGDPLPPETIERRQREADAALAAWARRSLHNRIEELRLDEARREEFGAFPRPPGLVRLSFAAVLGLVLGSLAVARVTGKDGLIAAAAARLGSLPPALAVLFAGG